MKNENYLQKAEFLLFQSQTDNEDIKVHVIVKDEPIWLSQMGLAELFEVDRSVISRHLKNIFC
ncbi:MAG: hypothetical protein IKN52_01865 [Victivallales bacterium]|nr:hypothetical protein [Victivallales bacterium]